MLIITPQLRESLPAKYTAACSSHVPVAMQRGLLYIVTPERTHISAFVLSDVQEDCNAASPDLGIIYPGLMTF